MINQKRFAKLLVRAGGNVQKGQLVIVVTDTSNADFARIVQRCAYDLVWEWQQHGKSFEARKEFLNNKQFESLRFTNSLGTDVTVGLPKNHIWQGGGTVGQDGVPYFPNIPTEEIFTAPDYRNVNGTVVASMPSSPRQRLPQMHHKRQKHERKPTG